MSTDFHEQLDRQIQFLQRSCDAFDNGYHDESIRIAVVLRVLFHSTRSSTSLIRHLNAENICLVDSRPPLSPTAVSYQGLGMHVLGSNSEFVPNLGKTPILNPPATLNEWWNQICFVLNGSVRITRKDLVLGAANKDGGAHVDANLSAEYEALSRDGALGAYVTQNRDESIETDIANAHFPSIRQIGYEVLSSPEFVALGHN